MVDLDNRYLPAASRFKAALDRGLFGELIVAEARLKWFRSDAYYAAWHGTWELDGGGPLNNQTVHYVDLLQWFVGLPETVRGCIGVYNHHDEAEDMAIATLHYPIPSDGPP